MPGFLSDLVDEAKPPQPIDLRPALNKPASFFGGMLLEGEDNPNLRPESRMELTLAKQAQQQKPLDEAASAVREKYGTEVKVDPHAYELSKQRAYYSSKEPSLLEYGILRSTPFASSLGQFGMAKEYKEARDRSTAGTAQPDDAKTIARYERLQELDAKQSESSGGAARLALAHLPAMIGEAYLTAGVAGELRGARAAGVAAKGVEGEGAAGQLGLRGFASRSANTAGGRLVTGTGQNLAQTAAMPSMYLPQSAERAIEKGGDWSDVDNLGRSYAIANLQVAVLGRLGPAGDAIPAGGPASFGTRLAVRTGTGMIEQQAVDSIAQATGLQDRKGTLYEAVNGEPDSLKNATTEAITFAAFSLMHGAPQKKGLKPKPLEIDPAKAQQAAAPIVQTIESLKAQGQTPQQIGDAMQGVHRKVDAALIDDPTLTKDQARKLFANDSPEIQKYAEVKIATLPDKKIPIRDSSLGPREAVLKEMGRQKGNEALLKLAVDLVPEEGGSREHAQQVAAKLPEGNLKRYAEQLIEQHFGPEPAKSPEPAKAPVEPAKSTPLDTGWKLGSDLATRAESVLGPDWAREVKALGFDADAAALKSYLDQVEAKSTPVEAAVPAAKPAGQSVAAPTSAKGEFVSSSDLRAILGRHNDGVHDASVEVDKLIGDRIAKGYTIVHWYENKPEAVTYEPATRQFDQHGNPETGILREANGNRIGLLASITASPGEKAGIEFVPPASRPAAGRKLPAPKDAVKVHEPAGELFDRLPDASKARLAKKAGISAEAYRSHADTNPSIAERVRGEVETLKQMGKPIAPEAAKASEPSGITFSEGRKVRSRDGFSDAMQHDILDGEKKVGELQMVDKGGGDIHVDFMTSGEIGKSGYKDADKVGKLGSKAIRSLVGDNYASVSKEVEKRYPNAERLIWRRGRINKETKQTEFYKTTVIETELGRKLREEYEAKKKDPFRASGPLGMFRREPSEAPLPPETAPEAPKPAGLPPQEPATAPRAEPASDVPEQKPVVPPADVTSKANTSAERVGEGKNVPEDRAKLIEEVKAATEKGRTLLSAFEAAGLTDKERHVLEQRTLEGRTQEAIGKDLGVTKERARQIEASALEKLKAIATDPEAIASVKKMIHDASKAGARADATATKGVVFDEKLKHDPKDTPAQSHEKLSKTEEEIERLTQEFLKSKGAHEASENAANLTRKRKGLRPVESRVEEAVRDGEAAADAEAKLERDQQAPGAEAPAPTVAVQRTEGLTPEERKREAEARVDYASQPKDDTILFAPPTTPSPAGTPQAPGPQVGQHDIVQKIRKDFDVPSYRDTPPFGSQSDAAYWTKHMAQITGNMAAGSAQKGIHEAAHHLATKYDLPDDPAQLGPGIAAGFKQFDYVPNRPNAKVAIQEGFAEWMRRYATDDLKNLTKEQQEAAFFAEAFLAMKGQAKKLDGIREQFRDFAKQNPIQKAAGELSGTGSIPEPGDTLVQRVKDLSHRIDDTIWDDLAVWDRVEADRVKSGLAPTPADKNPRLVYSQLRMRNGDTAAEIEQKGYFTIQNGKRVFTGRGLDHVLEPWTKEDMAPLGSKATSILGRAKGFFEDPKRISKAEVFLIANHVLGEVSRGKRPVSQDQIDLFQEAMNEFMKDPEFMKRATEGAKRYTENMNDGLRALASPEIHRLEPDQADYHIKDKPDYVPLNRVKEQENWQAVGGRSKGEFMPNPVKARKGSGEQIVSPFVSLRMKALERASQINEQMRRNAAMELLLSGGLGKYALPGMEQQVADKAGNVYDTHEPWPTDGTKPSFWWAGPGGKMTNVRIGDRALYDLLTNQQVESSQLAKLARAYSGLTISFAGKEFKPVEIVAKGVRLGATGLSLAFQLKNVPKDVYTFFSNTQSQASVASLPKAYGQMYLYELAKLFQMVSGKDVTDPVAKLFAEGRGGQMRQFAFEPSRPQSAYDRTQGGVIQKARNLVDIGKQLLTVAGAGELGPRYQEFKNELKKRGWDEGKLRSELNAAEAQRKSGGNYVEPVPLGDLFAAYDAAAEVTVPFGRQGTLTRELNKITPFFGPGVAGLSKQIRNWKSNPKGAAAAMGVLMGLRLLYWSMYHDEDWYGELSDYDRYNNFVVPIPGLGLRRLPGPRGLEVGTGGTLTSVLDASVAKNPRVGGLVSQSLQANLPPGIDRPAGSLAKGDYAGAAGEAAVAPLGPAGETGLDLIRNKDFTGRPIVPTRDENLPMRTKLTEKYLPYAVQQLSGGRGEPTLRGAGLEPVPQVKPKESVNVFYDTLKGMESERELAKKRGLKFEDEKKYDQMKKAEAKMTKLNAEARGEKRVGDKTVKIPVPDERRKDEIRLELIRLAKEALK